MEQEPEGRKKETTEKNKRGKLIKGEWPWRRRARPSSKDLVQSRRGWGEGMGADVMRLSRRKGGRERTVQGPQ